MEKENIIYHYCSLESFQSIITNKTLRLSDITKSNDSEEVIWIRNLIDKEFPEVYKEETDSSFKARVSNELWQFDLQNNIEYYFQPGTIEKSCYVMCFAGDDDKLSQWRGYGDDGKGVSIGFDVQAVKDVLKDNILDITFGKVEYDIDKQTEKVKAEAAHMIDIIKNEVGCCDGGEWDKNNGKILFTVKLDSYYMECLDKLFNISVYMKNPFFEEENEYRICYITDRNTVLNKGFNIKNSRYVTYSQKDGEHRTRLGDNGAYLEPIKFFIKDNEVSSYTDLKFVDNMGQPWKNIIRSVTIGPKCNVTEDEVRAVLYQNGFDVEDQNNWLIDVKKSEGSYR